jgi:hydrogenase expression/formation protein HypC
VCLAVPARIIERSNDQAVVDLQGNRLQVSAVLTPEVIVGDWVLVHAGFTITRLDEAEARETWEYIAQVLEDPAEQTGAEPTLGAEPTPPRGEV